MQKQALEVATKYEEEAKERLRRISLIAAGLEAAGRAKGPGLGGRGIDEQWYGEGSALGQPGAAEA